MQPTKNGLNYQCVMNETYHHQFYNHKSTIQSNQNLGFVGPQNLGITSPQYPTKQQNSMNGASQHLRIDQTTHPPAPLTDKDNLIVHNASPNTMSIKIPIRALLPYYETDPQKDPILACG